MIPLVVTLCLLLAPAAAPAQEEGALGPPSRYSEMTPEPMSRAQIAQIVADRGYFEVAGLAQQADGSWTCTALVGPGKRVALSVRDNGTITQQDLPPNDAR